MKERLRQIPKLDRLLQREDVAALAERWGAAYAATACRTALDAARRRVLADDASAVSTLVDEELAAALSDARLRPLQRVVNATGVLHHTNLGRVPFGRDLLQEVLSELSGACCLEIDLASGKRGVRGDFVRETAARLCGAEDALVVNNNAAAVLLVLSALADGREVLVSRGELIQIGGGFRIPDVIRQGGARLREVGTTNVTDLEDFRRALDEDVGAILKVHLSNFHVGGFSGRPGTKELAELKSENVVLIEDLGSGCLVERLGEWQSPDPTPRQALRNGADLVCFSGDKLLGGCQAGIVAGRKDLVARLAVHPLLRAIRPDKFTYAMLQAVLRRYELGLSHTLSPWRQAMKGRKAVAARARAFRRRLGLDADRHPVRNTVGRFGAGSLPAETIESAALRIADRNADRAAEFFRRADPPCMGYVSDGGFWLDFLTVEKEDEPLLERAARSFLREEEPS